MSGMDRIAALIDDALASNLGSAAAVSVGDAGVEVFRLVRGHRWRVPALGPPIDEQTPFDLASVTKVMVTATLAAQHLGSGALSVEMPVQHAYPHAATTGTVEQLLEHRAGCPAHVEYFRWLRGACPPDPRVALIDRATREPCAPPGGERVYSDLGFIMLGALIERAGQLPLEAQFAARVADPLGLAARFAPEPIAGAVATELDERGLVCGLVHDENCYYGGRVQGHAGLFASIEDVARFAAAAVARGPDAIWLGWDTPSPTPGVSQAGDRWPREHAVGHTGFTGTSLWLDLARRRWVALLTNRVHPTRHGNTADTIKALRRAVNDAAIDALT
jgi:CubicO group peptidase (beta-lactamase class C family)